MTTQSSPPRSKHSAQRLSGLSGQTVAEYRAARECATLVDRSSIGRLKVTGKDALDLLNRLSTNKLAGLRPGQGIATVLTTNKGRILDLLTVVSMPDYLLVFTGPQNQSKVAEWIDRYTFLEEVAVEDLTSKTVMLGVVGPKTWDALRGFTGQDMSHLPLFGCTQVSCRGQAATIVRTDAAGVLGIDLMCPAEVATEVREDLLKAGLPYGLAPIGEDAWEVLRVEEGVPRYGRELTEAVNPLEARLKAFISFNKGCYIGQEVVARLNTYKKVQRRLMSLRLWGGSCPAPGAKLQVNGTNVGVITSIVPSPASQGSIGMGYLKIAYAKPGTQVEVVNGEERTTAEVCEPPYLSRPEAAES